MKMERISKVVITAEHATRAQKQNLTQNERKLLLLCCNVFDNPQKIETFVGKKEQLEKLITKLQTEIPTRPKIYCLVQMISSLFKNVMNLLHLRIGINQLNDKIHQSFSRSFDNTPRSKTYRQMILKLMQCNLPKAKKDDILQKIESFYLLIIKEPEFILAPTLNIGLVNLIKNFTGLEISKVASDESFIDLKNAASLLANQFKKVKKNSFALQAFFEQAFNSEDLTFEDIFRRIAIYQPIVPPAHSVKVPNIQRVPDDENLNKNKEEVLFAHYENFLELQIEKFVHMTPRYEFMRNIKSWSNIKEEILTQKNFYQEYANTQNFKDYLLREKRILGIQCADGEIKQEELDQFINDYVNMGMLERAHEEEPYIEIDDPNNQLIKPSNEFTRNINTQIEIIKNESQDLREFLVKQECLKNQIKTLTVEMNKKIRNEYTDPYTEIKNSIDDVLNKLKERLRLENDENSEMAQKLKNQVQVLENRKPHLLKIIDGFYKLTLYRTYLVATIDYTKDRDLVSAKTKELIGLVIKVRPQFKVLPEHPRKLIDPKYFLFRDTTDCLFDSCPKNLLEAYKKAKQWDRLDEFFIDAFEPNNLDIENINDHFSDWVDNQLVFENFEQPQMPQILAINPEKTIKQNMAVLLENFFEIQIMKYAFDHNIAIDKNWFKVKGTKFHIKQQEKFENQYLSKENFSNALREAGIVNMQCLDGVLTQKILDHNIYMLQYSLYLTPYAA